MSLARVTEVLSLAQERLTRAIKTMDNDHAYIHQGKYYTAAFVNTIAASGTLKIGFKTPVEAAGIVHYRPAHFLSSADKLTLKFYEGAETPSEGTAITPVNRNRNSNAENGVVLTSGITVVSNGTQISEAYIPGAEGVGGSRSGADVSSTTSEWVLKPDTLYIIEYTNGSTAENIVFTELQWYEEEA